MIIETNNVAKMVKLGMCVQFTDADKTLKTGVVIGFSSEGNLLVITPEGDECVVTSKVTVLESVTIKNSDFKFN